MSKTTIPIRIDSDVKKILEKRAKREMMSLQELIENIIRKSASLTRGSVGSDNVEDKFITFFSRKTRKRKR